MRAANTEKLPSTSMGTQGGCLHEDSNTAWFKETRGKEGKKKTVN